MNYFFRTILFMQQIVEYLIVFDLEPCFNNSYLFVLKQALATLVVSGQIIMRSLKFSSSLNCGHNSSAIANICAPNFTRINDHHCQSSSTQPYGIVFLGSYCWVGMRLANSILFYFWLSNVFPDFNHARL